MLLDLPTELLTLVLQDLSLKDAIGLGRTCSKAYEVIQPHIYGSIAFDWPLDDVPPFGLLIRTLLEKPDYRSQVKQFSIKGTFYTSKRNGNPPVPRLPIDAFLAEDAASFIQAIGLPRSNAKQWMEELSQGAVDAVVSLLIALLPELEQLWLGSPVTIENPTLGELIRRSLFQDSSIDFNKPPLPGRKLVTVTIQPRCNHNSRYKAPKNTAAMLPFFYMPHLSTLSISIDNPDSIQWPAGLPPKADMLKSLELFRIREVNLLPILSAMPNLEQFEWHWFYISSLDPNVTREIVDLNVMSQALYKVKDTLTTLTIYAGTYPGINDIDFDAISTEGILDLTEFHKLKILHVPWAFLMGFCPLTKNKSFLQYLPSALETLVLSCHLYEALSWRWEGQEDYRLDWPGMSDEESGSDDVEDVEQTHEPQRYAVAAAVIETLRKVEQSNFPELRKIKMLWRRVEPDATLEQQNDLSQITASLGIELAGLKMKESGRFSCLKGLSSK